MVSSRRPDDRLDVPLDVPSDERLRWAVIAEAAVLLRPLGGLGENPAFLSLPSLALPLVSHVVPSIIRAFSLRLSHLCPLHAFLDLLHFNLPSLLTVSRSSSRAVAADGEEDLMHFVTLRLHGLLLAQEGRMESEGIEMLGIVRTAEKRTCYASMPERGWRSCSAAARICARNCIFSKQRGAIDLPSVAGETCEAHLLVQDLPRCSLRPYEDQKEASQGDTGDAAVLRERESSGELVQGREGEQGTHLRLEHEWLLLLTLLTVLTAL